MTPDECEHRVAGKSATFVQPDGIVRCEVCGLRFVPSDVLEEARRALEHCRHRPHEHNPLPDFTITRCDVIDGALARIDAVLGKK